MLFLEPFWVYASTAFLVASGRRQLSAVENIWGNQYFTFILIMVAGVFVPMENWILHKHTAWETTFLLESLSDSSIIALASLLHIFSTLTGYWLSVYQLRNYGPDAVIKSCMWAFSIFFSTQGMFYDTLLYSGTYEEFHNGTEKSFESFFSTERFKDAYIIFFLVFGPVFYFLAISWNSGCTKEEKSSFVKKLARQAFFNGLAIGGAYFLICGAGLLPPAFSMWRLIYILGMHTICSILVITPLLLCSTKQSEE